MAACSSSKTVRSILLKCGNYSRITAAPRHPAHSQLLFRQLYQSPALWGKNLAAAGPEKFSDEYIKKQIEEFNIGKRHLANMMGKDPEMFTQEDINRSIAYLFPSGLFEKQARPIMKHPDTIFPKQSAIQWSADGRPFNFLFYTGKQAYYSLMHEAFGKVLNIEKLQDRLRNKDTKDTKQMSVTGSRWLLKDELEGLLVETISDYDYSRFLQLMERLVAMPYSHLEETFVQQFREQLGVHSSKEEIPALQHDEKGVAFCQANGRRKTANASITLRDCRSGNIIVNGKSYLLYFPILQDREQLMFPLHFVGMLDRFDVEAHVEGGGRSAQAGALRLAISRALLSFVSSGEMESMRQAGLLTRDPRMKERKKPGQAGARKKFTWKKR